MIPKVERDPDVDDLAPTDEAITHYDERHFITYLRLLDARTDNADWREVSRIVLHRDPGQDPLKTKRCWESHLARAVWMTKHGYRHLLQEAAANSNGSPPPEQS